MLFEKIFKEKLIIEGWINISSLLNDAILRWVAIVEKRKVDPFLRRLFIFGNIKETDNR